MAQLVGCIFHNRYRIESLLGQQTGRRTCLATDLCTGGLVVIKLLLFGPDFTWSDLKLFEREAAVLKSLDHPAIPKYLNSFEVETELGKGFALVQSYIKAKSLQQWMQSGRTFSESELRAIATSLLKTLDYLHQRHPAVVHRDVKPSNILLGDRGWWGQSGQVYLVDFGAVQTVAHGGTRTVVGTYGYMPPEQFGGQTLPASDLYALGATLIHLASGQSPDQLPQREMQLLFENQVTLSSHWIGWLKWLTEPSLDRRAASAKQALEALEQSSNPVSASSPLPVQPPVSNVQPPVSEPYKERLRSVSNKSAQPPAVWSVVKEVLGAFTCAALGLGGLYFLVQLPTTWEQSTQITCQSADSIHTDCVVKYQGLFHSSESEKVIKNVKGVRLYRYEGSSDDNGHASISYIVQLQAKSDSFDVKGSAVKGIEDVRELQDLRNRFQKYIEHPRGRGSLTIPLGYDSGNDTVYIVMVCLFGPALILVIVLPFVDLIAGRKHRLQSVSSESTQPLTIQSVHSAFVHLVVSLIRFVVAVCIITSPLTLLFFLVSVFAPSPSVDPYLSQGEGFYQTKDYDQAIDAFSEALKRDPQDARTYVKRGSAFVDKKDYDHALADYTQALKLDPKNADFYIDRGNIFDAQKDHDRALADYNQALELDKDVY